MSAQQNFPDLPDTTDWKAEAQSLESMFYDSAGVLVGHMNASEAVEFLESLDKEQAA